MIARLLAAFALLFSFSTSFCQWTRVQQIPPGFIATLYHKDNILYAGGANIIYFSRDQGLTWDSTSTIPEFILVTSIIVFKNELYAAAANRGVLKSPDGGATWQKISSGKDTLDVSDFCEFRGDLYASTFSNSIYKLDPVTRNKCSPFSKGIGSLSLAAASLISNGNAMIAGTLNNGLYDYLAPGSDTWEERMLPPPVSVNEGVFYFINAHDTLIWPGRTGIFYMSTDGGLNWNHFGNRLTTGNNSIVNAKQALLVSRYFFDGANFINAFYYLKKDSLQSPFVNFSVVPNLFTWKIDILGDKLWDATDKGLFFMHLADLPGITAVDDSVPTVLPLHFISFTSDCETNKVTLTWKTAQAHNSSHFNIEKSADGITWTLIGSLSVTANSATERSYSFTDNTPLQDNSYRIVEYDPDGKVQYSKILEPSCNAAEKFKIWPNPVHDIVFITIVTGNESAALIKVIDANGAMMKLKKVVAKKGSNKFSIDVNSLASGIYFLTVSWANGQEDNVIRLFKK